MPKLEPHDPRILRMQAVRRARLDAEPAGGDAAKISPFEGWVTRIGAFWKGLTAFLFSLAGVITIIYFLFLLWHVEADQSITIATISVPKDMAEKGYTPEVVATRLRSAFDQLATNARNANINAVPLELAKSGSKAISECYGLGAAGIKTKLVSEIPDVTVPDTGLSVGSIAGMIRDFENVDNRTILTGEITSPKQNPSLQLHLQLGGEQEDLAEVHSNTEVPDTLFEAGAEEVIEEKNPLLLALALVNHDPRKAVRVVNSFIYKASLPTTYATETKDVSGHWFNRVSARQTGSHSDRQCSMKFAHILRANALRNSYRNPEAIDEIRRDTVLYPDDPFIFLLAAIMLNEQSKADEAIKDLDAAIRLDPAPPQYYANKCISKWILADRDKSRLDEAISQCRQAVQHRPTFSTSHVFLGLVLQARNRDQAMAEFREAIRLDAWNSDAYDDLGEALFAAKKYDDAITQYRKFIELNPRGSDMDLEPKRPDASLDSKLSDAYNKIGVALINLHETDGALVAYGKSIEINPNNFDAHDNLGLAFFSQKNIDSAITEFKKAAAIRPNSPVAQGNLAAAAGSLGSQAYELLLARKFEASLDASDRAIAAAPHLLWPYTNRAHALMFLGRIDEARKVYLGHRGEKVEDDTTWDDAIRNDFVALRKQGLTNPLMSEIERTMAKAH